MFAAEITIVCESVKRGCEYRALFFDRPTERFYGGSGPTALEALAWCMDEYIGRVVYGLDVSPARAADAAPGSRFAGLTPAERTKVPTPVAATIAVAPQPTKTRKRGKKAA